LGLGDGIITDYLTPRLENKKIPLTKNCDRVFAISRKDSVGDPVDWDAEIYMLIDIDRASPTQVDAVVVDELATIRVEADVADLCRTGTTWRVVMQQDTDPTTETPLLVGTFERNDGK